MEPSAVRHAAGVLAVAASAQLLIAMDSTVMNVALPAAQAELGFADGMRHWVVTAYALAFGSLLLPGARVGERLGVRRALWVGAAGFAVASLAGGLAPTFGVLILARVVQGAAAALVAPAALAALSRAYSAGPGPGRGRAFGVYGAVGVAGTALGLLAGGPLTQALSWRATLLVLVLLALAVLAGAIWVIPAESGDAEVGLGGASALAVTGGLFAVVLALSLFETGQMAPASLVMVAGLVALVVFWRSQPRAVDPLVPPRVVTHRLRAGALIALGMSAAGLFAVFLFVVYALQRVLGFGPVAVSAAIVPFPLIAVISSLVLAPVLRRRIGERRSLVIALLAGAAGMGWLAFAMLNLSGLGGAWAYAAGVLPTIVTVAAAMGVIYALGPDLATAGLAQADSGVGASLVHVVQQIGGAVGIAVLNAVASALPPEPPSAGYAAVFAATAAVYALGAIGVGIALGRRRAGPGPRACVGGE